MLTHTGVNNEDKVLYT